MRRNVSYIYGIIEELVRNKHWIFHEGGAS